MKINRKIAAAAAAAVVAAAVPVVIAAAPASAACLPPDVVVTHGAAFAEAHVIHGCDIRVWADSAAYGRLYGPWRSGGSTPYSDIIRSHPDLHPVDGGWQQEGHGLHRTFG